MTSIDHDAFDTHKEPETIDLDDWDPPADDSVEQDCAEDDLAFEQAIDAKMDSLRELYIETPRDHVLDKQFKRLITEKYSPAEPRRWAGLVLEAPSGAGKTRMLNRYLGKHPRVHGFGTDDTNFIAIDTPSPVTNKTLGLEVLRTMYPQSRGAVTTRQAPLESELTGETEDFGLSDIWREARRMSEDLDVWGLWIDEAHDLRNGGPKMLDVLQASLKRWMAQAHRPIIILSGTPEVEQIFLTREFRRRFLAVKSPTLGESDTGEIRRIMAQYLRQAELGADGTLRSIMPRLLHAGTRQIGWTLDVILEAIRVALLNSDKALAWKHFSDSYGEIIQCADHENPFIANDWAGIDTVLHHSRKPQADKNSKRRRKREETLW